jgi:hypothetical protein
MLVHKTGLSGDRQAARRAHTPPRLPDRSWYWRTCPAITRRAALIVRRPLSIQTKSASLGGGRSDGGDAFGKRLVFLAVVSMAGFNARQGDPERPRATAGAGSQTTQRASRDDDLETRETTQPPARAKLNGRIVQVTGTPRGVGAAIGRSLASKVGRPDGVARMVHLLFADGCSLVIGRVCALDGGGQG